MADRKLGIEQFAGFDPAGCGVVPIGCKPNKTLGFDADGDPACLDVHPPAQLTSTNAPFAWDVATQTGNVPLPGKMSVNSDGTVTFTPGDGTAPTTFKQGWTTVAAEGTELLFTYPDGTTRRFDLCTIAAPCMPKPTVTANPDGSVTIDPGTGAPAVTIPAPTTGGVETPLSVIDSYTVDFDNSGPAGHTLTANVKIDDDPCNRLMTRPEGLFVQDVHHVMFSINEEVQASGPGAWEENDQTLLVEGYNEVPITGELLLVNPSQCLEMDFMLNARAHTVLWGGLDSTTVAWDRTIVLLEINSGGGFEWISAKQATRVVGSFTGVGLPEGEMWQDYSREHYVSVPAGGSLTIPYQLRVAVVNGQGYAVELWRPSFSVIGIAS